MNKKKLISIIGLILLLIIVAYFQLDLNQPSANPQGTELAEDGYYSTPEDVALYIHTYGRLPANFITKSVPADGELVGNFPQVAFTVVPAQLLGFTFGYKISRQSAIGMNIQGHILRS